MDPATYQSQEVKATLAQLARAELHDSDFEAFRKMGLEVSCILDVGANRGQSLASLRSIFPSAEIHSFEANPLFAPVLERVAQEVKGCKAYAFGLGRVDGRFTLYVPWVGDQPFLEESSTLPSYFEKPWVAQKFAERGALRLQEMSVEIRRGDDLSLSPQVIKIDVEGAENDVIEGLRETIQRCSPILMVENSDYVNVTATLAGLGYRPYRYEAESDALVPFYGLTTNAFYRLG